MLQIGELAKRAAVSADTIRYYERIGLLPKAARTSSGYRVYKEPAVARVQLIQNALQFGFTLKELGAFLGVRHAGGAPCRQVRAAGAQILETADQRIKELLACRESIQSTLDIWDQRLEQVREGEPARLLETLPASSGLVAMRRGFAGKTSRAARRCSEE